MIRELIAALNASAKNLQIITLRAVNHWRPSYLTHSWMSAFWLRSQTVDAKSNLSLERGEC